MKIQGRVLLLLLIPTFCMATLIPKEKIKETIPLIRVRLHSNLKKVSIKGLELRFFEQGFARRGHAEVKGFTRWQVKCRSGYLWVRSSKKRTFVFHSPMKISSQTGLVKVKNQLFRNEIWIHSKGKKCDVINRVSIEKYLVGLINSEFSSSWNIESVKAQAIAARSYAYVKIKNSTKRHFDVEASSKDQVYEGFSKEDQRAKKILRDTRGMILSLGGKSVFKAFYHSTCGGQTELPERVWGRRVPGYQRVRCPYCRSSPRYRWQLEINQKDLIAKLKLKSKGIKILRIESGRERIAGRTSKIRLLIQKGKKNQWIEYDGTDFRSKLNPAELRSTAFWVKRSKKGWILSGRGNGHGVGLCQWGAKVMGEKGFKMNRILAHYYPQAIIKKIW